MSSLVSQAADAVRSGTDLKRGEMRAVMDRMVSGDVPAAEIRAFLVALHDKGETVDELVGAAESLRGRMEPVRTSRTGVTDTCGTGGSGLNTFNISTAAAIVAAAAGAAVAKHGNRRLTGSSGSSDVLTELGVNVLAPLPVVERCLEDLGICFCFAPLHHPSVRHVMEVRRSLAHPTVFNWLGPLCNPARAEFQLLGAGRADKLDLLAGALAALGTGRGLVIHSRDGIGEVSTGAATDGRLVTGPSPPVNMLLSAEDFGVGAAGLETLLVNSPAESARMIREVLVGGAGPARDIVVINAATVLWTCGLESDLENAAGRAAEAIDSARAARLLDRLVEQTNRVS